MSEKMIIDKKELIEKLKKCGENTDREGAHYDADELLLQHINDEEIAAIWKEISTNFWYA